MPVFDIQKAKLKIYTENKSVDPDFHVCGFSGFINCVTDISLTDAELGFRLESHCKLVK